MARSGFFDGSGRPVFSTFGVGFRSARYSLVGAVLGLFPGGLIYQAQSAPSCDPVVVLNAFARVLTVSIPEVLVCWAVVVAAMGVLLRPLGWIAVVIGSVLASNLLFGLHHVAHSPPFNAPPMIALLTGVGLVTSACFFSLREVYGTILFHNGPALFGVVRVLAETDKIADYGQAKPALYAMAAAMTLVLISGDLLWPKKPRRPSSHRRANESRRLGPTASAPDWARGREDRRRNGQCALRIRRSVPGSARLMPRGKPVD